MRTKDDLKKLQAFPLGLKILITKQRIREWVDWWGSDRVYVSFSGGKDSTVLLDLVRREYPDVEAVFVNTGLEYPEIQQFVRTFENVTILRPEMCFDEVIKKFGYPIISKQVSDTLGEARRSIESGVYDTFRVKRIRGELTDHNGDKSIYCCDKYEPLLHTDFYASARCCAIMKKAPLKKYGAESCKKPITAQMASESVQREIQWRTRGCNGFDMEYPMSNPMSIWTEQDVLQYIKDNNIQIASVYGDIVYKEDSGQMRIENFGISGCGADKLCTTGCSRTGCIFCAFGAHLEKPGEGRFERLKETHPRQYEYCIGGGEYDENGIWKPNKDGLGMKHVFDELNKIYGQGFIKY